MTNAQEYWIEGFYERHGENQYTLKDIHTQGIYIDGKTSLSQTLYGEMRTITCDGLQADMVKFTFSRATTDCQSKWQNGFTFQYWDEDNYKWKDDVEACRGDSIGYSENQIVIMLVLDFSFSMKDNINKMKEGAIDFIETISKASNGNIHVGIIAFSGMKLAKDQVFDIRPLSQRNAYQFEDFIRQAEKGKETALYFSMDKAINDMEAYVNTHGFSENKFNGTYMLTFSDGFDNASVNDNISPSMPRGRKNPYLKHLSTLLKAGSDQKFILGKPVENFAIGFTGSEKFTQEDLAFFDEVLMQVTPDRDHFKTSNNIDDISTFFKDFARSLTERWENLQMYVGEAQYGKVRWVLQCGSPEPRPIPIPDPPKPKPEVYTRSPWFGISAEFGYCSDFLYGLNFDMAFSLNESFAVGARLGVISGSKKTEEEYYYYGYYDYYGYSESSTSQSIGFLLGPEIKITYPENNALLVSCGPGLVNDNFSYFCRFGYKTKKSFFITAEGLSDGDNFGGGIGIGWSFGGKLRKK